MGTIRDKEKGWDGERRAGREEHKDKNQRKAIEEIK